MSRRSWTLFAGAALLVAAVPLVPLWLVSGKPGITRSSYERISLGTSLQQVEVQLGGPARSEVSKKDEWLWELDGKVLKYKQRMWSTDTFCILLHFDEHDRVAAKQWASRDSTLWERIRDWFGW